MSCKTSLSLVSVLLLFVFPGSVCLETRGPGKGLKRNPNLGWGYANFVKHANHSLDVQKVETSLVDRVGQCALHCVSNLTSFSFNIAINPNANWKYTCETLATDRYNASYRYRRSTDFDHYSIYNPCVYEPCKNAATCLALYEEAIYRCMCPRGFEGLHCETEINECASNPCLNMGVCTDKFGMYECSCLSGFQGSRCETALTGSLKAYGSNVCSRQESYRFQYVATYLKVDSVRHISRPCGFWGIRRCYERRVSYVKAYRTSYRVEYKTVYYCCPGWAQHARECTIDIDECASSPCKNNGTCLDELNRYTCNCTTGFTGTKCETEIDECASSPCRNNGTCLDELNRYTCNCTTGFTGTNCETDINECASNPCHNDAACVDMVNGYSCMCNTGFTGDSCQTDINECSSNPCQNGGACVDRVNGYNCTCAPGYTDENCQTNINECSSNPCKNGGTCVDHVNGYTCTCVPGYNDKRCQRQGYKKNE